MARHSGEKRATSHKTSAQEARVGAVSKKTGK